MSAKSRATERATPQHQLRNPAGRCNPFQNLSRQTVGSRSRQQAPDPYRPWPLPPIRWPASPWIQNKTLDEVEAVRTSPSTHGNKFRNHPDDPASEEPATLGEEGGGRGCGECCLCNHDSAIPSLFSLSRCSSTCGNDSAMHGALTLDLTGVWWLPSWSQQRHPLFWSCSASTLGRALRRSGKPETYIVGKEVTSEPRWEAAYDFDPSPPVLHLSFRSSVAAAAPFPVATRGGVEWRAQTILGPACVRVRRRARATCPWHAICLALSGQGYKTDGILEIRRNGMNRCESNLKIVRGYCSQILSIRIFLKSTSG
jgi:hypothetical protein